MIFVETRLLGALILEPEKFADERGFFARSFCAKEFAARGIDFRLAQCDISFNRQKGTLRGLHYQAAPHEEAKIVRCTKGAIHDVIVDLRPKSPTYKRWVAFELSEENGRSLYVPAGLAHGFQTLTDGAEVIYLMSEFYHPECGTGVRWNDPTFAIPWPLPPVALSQGDEQYPDYFSPDGSTEDSSSLLAGSRDEQLPHSAVGLSDVLARAGEEQQLRAELFEALRRAELSAMDSLAFRNVIRLPMVRAIMGPGGLQRVVLKNGLLFDVGLESRIEEALLLSLDSVPDHVWEPQTTKLLVELGRDADHVVIGGAYIGDQALLIAQEKRTLNRAGIIHAFEPFDGSFQRLSHHIEINHLANVIPRRLCLWDASHLRLKVEGLPALGSSLPARDSDDVNTGGVNSISIDDYAEQNGITAIGLIMLDTEGGEERALRGAERILSKPFPHAPNLVFEVHRDFVDWSKGLENTPIVSFVRSKGYAVFAIRDFHSNYSMEGRSIEIIPMDHVYLDGPPHGFNMLATKDSDLIKRLGLRLVNDVSPKLLLHKDPALHHPLDQ